jgi:hypothetical protein
MHAAVLLMLTGALVLALGIAGLFLERTDASGEQVPCPMSATTSTLRSDICRLSISPRWGISVSSSPTWNGSFNR